MAKPEDRKHALYAKTLHELRDLSDGDLIAQHDQMIEGGQYTASPVYYLQELSRREQDRQTAVMVSETASMVEMTRTIKRLTWVVGVLTAVNVAVAVLGS